MAHMIAKTVDGRDAIAYVGSKPWHGLGQKLEPGAPLQTWIKEAGLDWDCLCIPSSYRYRNKTIVSDKAFHMVRSDTGESLSVMSKRFKPVQPSEIMAFFRDYVLADDRFALETAGCLFGGAVIWALAKFNGNSVVVGEDHAFYVMLMTAFDGSKATTGQGTAIRVVCANTMAASLYSTGSASFRIRHDADFSRDDIREDAAKRLATTAEGFAQYKAMAEALHGIRLAKHQVEGLFQRLTIDKTQSEADRNAGKPPSMKAVNQLGALLEAYKDTLAEGTKGGTGWAVINGITRYVDHSRTVRDSYGDGEDSARMASAFLGTGAALKKEALGLILEAVNTDLGKVLAKVG